MRTFRMIWRSVLFSVGICIIYFIIVLGRTLCKVRGRSWIGWRNKWVRCWARFTIWLSGGRLKVIGQPPKPPFVLVSNHLSYIDIPAFFASVNSIFVSKKEVRSWPFLGAIAAGVNTIFVDRSKRSDVVRVNELIAEQIDDQKGLIVFPEGTSTEGAEVLPFKPSLLAFPASQGLPVHYATLTYRTPPGEIPAHIALCWAVNGDPFLVHLKRFIGISSYEVEVRYGAEPVVATDRKILADELWKRVSEEFEPSVVKESDTQTLPS